MLIFGVDPGESGGICAINSSGAVLMYFKMNELYDAIAEAKNHKKTDQVVWIIEKAQSMPGNGGKAMFTYGMNYGKIIASVQMNAIPYKEIRPSTWTKAMFTGNIALLEGKQRNIKLLKLLAPNLAEAITPRTKPHMGICDAYLVAEYARRHMIE